MQPSVPAQTLPEKEAKTVVAQILSGLVYLNTKPFSVIHYDLKVGQGGVSLCCKSMLPAAAAAAVAAAGVAGAAAAAAH